MKLTTVFAIIASVCAGNLFADDTLVFEAKNVQGDAPHAVLIAGDEEYRTEETMPMLAKLLSQKHGFKCTVLFAFGPDGASHIDPNNSKGLRGLEALDSADLMIIGTRFRQPDETQAAHIAKFLNAGKPVIGIRTATHAFNGNGSFGGIGFGEFGRKVLCEQWVSHHGHHKKEGCRGVIEEANASHAILNGVADVFAPSDVYGVTHLTDSDTVLMRGAVTETLDPASKIVEGEKNEPMQALAWLHTYKTPDGNGEGRSFCTTAGASVDFVSEDLRRIVVNAAYFLLDKEVPRKADVDFVDPYYPSFYGFIKEQGYWQNLGLTTDQLKLGHSTQTPDPKGSPEWNFRPTPPAK